MINKYEKGLLFKDNECIAILDKGYHLYPDVFSRYRIEKVKLGDPWFAHKDLRLIVLSGLLENHAEIIDLKDDQRALVWMDNRFNRVLGPGLYAVWKGGADIRIETVTTENIRFEHSQAHAISNAASAAEQMDIVDVVQGSICLFYNNGKLEAELKPGRYLFWKKTAKTHFYHIDMRENVIDISGQEIMTSDKVTLRLNAVLCYKVHDAAKSVSTAGESVQALYRETQLALRSVVGTYEIDTLLSEKERVAKDLEAAAAKRAGDFGVTVISLGIRDIILPGEMKTLLNRVIEARKAADANLITRREETAAIRSQANTAKILEQNPTLMRLRELDLLEKIACDSKMSIVLGEKGLADRIVNLL